MINTKFFVSFLALYLVQEALQAEVLECAIMWSSIENIIEEEIPVFVTPQIPNDGVIAGFTIRRLLVADDVLFQPRTMQEAICALDRMLSERTKEALRRAVVRYVEQRPAEIVDTAYRRLNRLIDDELNEVYVNGGMQPNSGILLIQAQIELQFGIKPYGGVEYYGSLQSELYELGVTLPALALDWIWIHYLEQLGVDEFSVRSELLALRP